MTVGRKVVLCLGLPRRVLLVLWEGVCGVRIVGVRCFLGGLHVSYSVTLVALCNKVSVLQCVVPLWVNHRVPLHLLNVALGLKSGGTIAI